MHGAACTARGLVLERFAEQVRQAPHRVAVAGISPELTYGGLDAASDRLALALTRRGVRPEERVAVEVDRSERTVVALLGVLKAGAAYLPIDPDYPAERVRHLQSDSGCRLLVHCGSRRLQARLEEEELDVAEETARPETSCGGGRIRRPIDPRQLAYVLYTSGSTGRPKGVLVEHRSLANVVDDHLRAFEVTPDDRILLFSSPAFDAYLFQVFIALLTGAAAVPLPAAVLGDPRAFLGYLREQRISILSVPPAYLNALGQVPLEPVRLINTGGDASIPADALFHARYARYFSTYGPTEATICSAWHEVDPAGEYPGGIPLGRPVANVTIQILADDLAPAPAGQAGEIAIAGPGVARAYLGHPDLTAERFVPCAGAAGERLYLTGDLGRRRDDGEVEFLGRRDRQVKVRGHRIEPAEIEQHLERHPAVDRAVVVVHGSDARRRRLIAYVTAREEVSPGALRSFLRRHLPAAWTPSAMIRVDEMPLTAHGKVDRAALSARGVPATGSGGRPPRTDAERRLAALWEGVLGTGPVGAEDELLDLGGDSIVAARLVSEMRRRLGVEAGVPELLAGTCVAQLAERMGGPAAGAVGLGASAAAAAAAGVAAVEAVEASHAQTRLWLIDQLADRPGAYNISQLYGLEGPLELPSLLAALRELTARHPALRATFEPGAEGPCLRIGQGTPFSPAVVDLAGAAGAERAVQPLAEGLAMAPFDLARGPLCRAVIVRTARTSALLLLSVHHIVCDGWSFGILTRDLGRLYAAAVSRTAAGGSGSAAEGRGLRYGALQRARLAGGAGRGHREHWLSRLRGAAPLELPLDRPRTPERSFAGATLTGDLGGDLPGNLQQLGRRQRATLFMTLVALVKILLARYTGQEDVTVGAPMTDRDDLGLAGEVGFFVNTVALRDRVEPQQSFAELLDRVRRTCLEAYEHQVYPFDRLVEELGEVRDPSRSPVFDVMVALQREADVLLSLPGIDVSRRPLRDTGSKLDLSFDFIEGAGLTVAVEHSTALLDTWRIRRAIGHLRELAAEVCAAPGRPISELRLLTPEEVGEIASWQGPAAPFPEDLPLADLFAAVCDRNPHRLALAGTRGGIEVRLTYTELRGLVERLAAHLRRHPAFRPAARIGILAERSPLFFVAALAVLEAGAAFVPLDAGWPDRRIEQALETAGSGLLLVDGPFAGLDPVRRRAAVLLDGLEKIPAAGAPPCRAGRSPGDLAYCIFTSGSTGRPKGVAVTHCNAVQAVEMWRHDYRLARPVVLQLASFSFDVSVGDLCRSLLVGGTLVVAGESERLDPAAIVDLAQRYGVTCFETTPVVARMLIPYLEESGRRLPDLGILVVGSDVWYGEEMDRLRRLLPAALRLLNSYGTTETTVDSLFYEAAGALEGRGRFSPFVPIGRPMANVEVLVADAAGRSLPVGIPGEIRIAGPGVAAGYLGDPAQTAAKFLPHPGRPGERLYATGDLGVWTPEGRLEILGRSDRQAKIRGVRIEPGEIESALLSHPDVEGAVAVVTGPADRAELVAYVAARRPVSPAELRRLAAGRLPSAMIPAAWVFLDRLPTTSSGKIDRAALPGLRGGAREGDEGVAPGSAAPVPPRTPAESRLLALWRSVLPARRAFGVEDSFFALGGDSLRAVQLTLAAARQGLALRAHDLFRHPTVAELAAHLTATSGGGIAPVPLELADVDPEVARRAAGGLPAEDVYPALELQGEMWRASREHPPEEGVFHGQSLWRVRLPRFSRPALRRALAAVAARHPALRTELVEHAGELYQVVRPAALLPVAEVDLRELPAPARAAEIERYLPADAQAGFPPAVPLCRFAVFLHTNEEIEVVCSAHHAVDDGWGAAVLERELFEVYLAEAAGRSPGGVDADRSCKERAALERESVLAGADAAFWQAELAGLEPTPAPRYAAGGGRRFAGLSLRAPAGGALRERAAALGVSAKALCLAAVLESVSDLLGAERAAAGAVMNGRSERLSNPLGALGLFWSLVPVRAVPGAGGGELVREVERRLRRAEPHALYPLSRIAAGSGGRLPFFCCFNFVDLHGHGPLPPPLQLLGSRWIEVFPYPLTVAVVPEDDGGGTAVHLQHDRRHVSDTETAELGRRLLERLA